MNFLELESMDREYISGTYARFPLAVSSGKGALCRAIDGAEYIDFTAGIGVNSLGFCDDDWVAAVQKQAAQLAHISNLYYTEPAPQLAKKLCERTGCKKVFFANSGAEANEGMIKVARKYSFDKYGEGRSDIITLVNSFHGRTVTTLSATGQDSFHTKFAPFTQGFSYALANDINDVMAKLSDKTCGIILEPIQGEGGVIPLTKAFVQAVEKLCKQRDILLMFDEVQTGMGRTGTLLACEQFGAEPDLVSLAKGLGGGLPIGAVLLYEKCMKALQAGDHGTTFGGNPIVCAGANVVLDKLTEPLLAEVRRKSNMICEAVLKMPHVKNINELGLMLGVEFTDIEGRAVVEKCLAKGVMFLTAKAKLRMLPPLIITDEQIKTGLNALQNVLVNWEEN